MAAGWGGGLYWKKEHISIWGSAATSARLHSSMNHLTFLRLQSKKMAPPSSGQQQLELSSTPSPPSVVPNYFRTNPSLRSSQQRLPVYLPPISDDTANWGTQFISSRGNEYFCEIDEEYLTDRFNLTGLNTEVPYYQYALDLVTDVFDLDADDDLREQIEKSARHLYGLVHARYIVTTRGLAKMVCTNSRI